LFVGGLPFDFSDDQLRALVAQAGTVLSSAMVPDPKNKRTRGFGFVTVSGKEEALAVIKMLNGTKVGEKSIYITEAREKPPRKTPPPRRTPHAPLYPHPSIDERKPSYRDPRRARGPRRRRPER
jgi:RNA recognition motif-containing protein